MTFRSLRAPTPPLVLALLLAPLPAVAVDGVAARIAPLQPELGRDFTVVVTGSVAPEGLAEVAGVGLDPDPFLSRLVVTIREAPCAGCTGGAFSLDVPIDGSLPFEEQQPVALVVRDAATDDVLFERLFALGSTFFHSLRPEVVLDPRAPTDNDAARLLIASEPNVCGPSPPTLDRVQHLPGLFRVFLRFSGGFGGSTRTAGPSPSERCSPAVPFLSALSVDLGQLEPGEYDVEVYLEDEGATLPIRTNRRAFEVTDAPDAVVLQNGLFEVRAEWTDFEGASGTARPVADPADDSTLFTFFDRENWELMAKVLDGCGLNDHYWVFLAASTSVEYTVTVTDTRTGFERSYRNDLGVAAPAVTDTTAFPCS